MSGGVQCRVPMQEVNPHVMCVLCGGYFIDATTIIECLHSFCRKCIVTYLESSRFCPICDVQVHKTKPLLSIRPDATLQDIVYKLVPGLYRDEMRRRREFYASRPASDQPRERGEARGEERRAVFAPDELMEVRLQYFPGGVTSAGTGTQAVSGGPGTAATAQVRYLRCPAVVTVGHLQHMLSCKHELPNSRMIELLARGDVLTPDLMLLDVAYLHCWRRVGPLQLFYRIVAAPPKQPIPPEVKTEAIRTPSYPCDASDAASLALKTEFIAPVKEEIPVAQNGDQVSTRVLSDVVKSEVELGMDFKVDSEVKRERGLLVPVSESVLLSGAAMRDLKPTVMSVSDVQTPVLTANAGPVSSVKFPVMSGSAVTTGSTSHPFRKTSTITTSATKTTPASSSSNAGGIPHKEVQLHISETGEMSFGGSDPAAPAHVDILQQACKILDSLETDEHPVTPAVTSQAVTTAVSNGPTLPAAGKVKTPIKDSNKNEIIVPVSASSEGKQAKTVTRPSEDASQKRPPMTKGTPPKARHGRLLEENRKRSSPVGYKTLKTPPKSWNPQLPRSYVGGGQKTSTSTEGIRTMSPIAPKPPRRFFRVRDNETAASGIAAVPDPARTPLLMRVEPATLGTAVWPTATDQLLPTGPLIYPHLYVTQPLPFLPTAGMFVPPPAHSGVTPLTYTSASGVFTPLLTPPTPQPRHSAVTPKTATPGGSPKAVLSSLTRMATVSSGSSSAAATVTTASAGKQRSHVVCSVPSTRPRPMERPMVPSPIPSPSRLPLNAFFQQLSSPPLGLAGMPVLGPLPRMNGHPSPPGSGLPRRPASELSTPSLERSNKRPRTETTTFNSINAAYKPGVPPASASAPLSASASAMFSASIPLLASASTPLIASASTPLIASASGPLLAPISLKAPSAARPPNSRGSESRPSPKPAAPPPPPGKPPAPPSALQPDTKAVLPS